MLINLFSKKITKTVDLKTLLTTSFWNLFSKKITKTVDLIILKTLLTTSFWNLFSKKIGEKPHNDGEALRVLSTKLFCENKYNGHVNSVGYGNNGKNWVIRG